MLKSGKGQIIFQRNIAYKRTGEPVIIPPTPGDYPNARFVFNDPAEGTYTPSSPPEVWSDDTYTIMGMSSESNTIRTEGAVYVYDSSDNFLRKIQHPNPSWASGFGSGLARSGNLLAVTGFEPTFTGSVENRTVYIFDITTGAHLHTITNPNTDTGNTFDLFGHNTYHTSKAITLSGNKLCVAAQLEDNGAATQTGVVYIYDLSSGTPTVPEFTLTNPTNVAGDNFGYSIDSSGNYLAVGAPNVDSGITNSGIAYVYNLTTGALINTISNPNDYSTGTNDRFGWHVAFNGTTLFISSPGERTTGTFDSGRVYSFDATTGARLSLTLINENEYSTGTGDYFGDYISTSGDYIAILARNEDRATRNNIGRTYVYRISTGALLFSLPPTSEQGFLYLRGCRVNASQNRVYSILAGDLVDAENGRYVDTYDLTGVSTGYFDLSAYSGTAGAGDQFGYAVDIDGNNAIVGAPFTPKKNPYNGYAYIVDASTGLKTRTISTPNVTPSEFVDQFGRAVAISGNYAAVSARVLDTNYDDLTSEFGRVYVYNVTTGALLYSIDNPNSHTANGVTDEFGANIELDGTNLVVSAHTEGKNYLGTDYDNSGVVYLFDVTTGSLTTTYVNPNPDSTPSGDQFGYSISIKNGRMVVGAPYEDSFGTSGVGKAYVYNLGSTFLQQTLGTVYTYSTIANDRFGMGVAINDSYTAIGSPYEDAAGQLQTGVVQVYNSSGTYLGVIQNPNNFSTADNDRFGEYIEITDTNKIIVGVPLEDSADAGSNGVVYVFDAATRALEQTLYSTVDNPHVSGNTIGDSFGSAISSSGSTVIVGAPKDYGNSIPEGGSAQTFLLP